MKRKLKPKSPFEFGLGDNVVMAHTDETPNGCDPVPMCVMGEIGSIFAVEEQLVFLVGYDGLDELSQPAKVYRRLHASQLRKKTTF